MRTFLDSGVLLTAWRGRQAQAEAALAIMEDRDREFFTSQLVELELMPKPAFFGQRDEIAFYQTHFAAAKGREMLSAVLGQSADRLARRYGLAAVDALHVAAAIRQRAEEFITTEKAGKPLFRVREIRVISLDSVVT